MVSTGGTEGRFTMWLQGVQRAGSQCGEYRGYRGQVHSGVQGVRRAGSQVVSTGGRGQVHSVVGTGGTEGRFTM